MVLKRLILLWFFKYNSFLCSKGQSCIFLGTLFHLLKEDGSIGFALSLVHRIRGLTISAIGFLIIMRFTLKTKKNNHQKN